MPLDILDDVLVLHFALKAAQSDIQGLALCDMNFSHIATTPPFRDGFAWLAGIRYVPALQVPS